MSRIKKLVTTAKVIDVILIIALCFLVASCAFLVFNGVFTAVTGSVLANITFKLNDVSVAFASVAHDAVWIICLLYCSNFIFYIFGIHVLRKILSYMKKGKPFDPKVGNHLRTLGFLVIIGWIVNVAVNVAIIALLRQAIAAPDVILGSSGFKINIDFTYLILAAVFFLLSYIFKYGEELQHLSDETI